MAPSPLRLALGLWVCAASVAQAAELTPTPKPAPPSIAIALVGTDPGTADQADKVEAAVSAALEREGKLLPAKPKLEATAPAPADDGEIAAHLKAAQDAYNGLDLDTAAKEYGLAIRAAFEHPERADVAQVADTFLKMGAAYQLNGDVPHAEAAYRFALALRPAIEPDPQLFGPDLRKSIDAQREQLKAAVTASPASLDVELDGAAAGQVTIDGEDAGPAPLHGYTVFPGRHLVVVHAKGFITAAQVVNAAPGESTSAKIALEETPDHKLLSGARTRALAERTQSQPGPGILDLAQKTGATLVAVGALSSNAAGSTHLELTLFDARGNARLAGLSRDLDVDTSKFPAEADALAHELAGDSAGEPVEAPTPGVAGRPIYKRWYFWAGVGAAVVAGSVAAVAVGTSGHPSHGAGVALGF